MAPKFGTSGVRGLVSELSEEIVTRYVKAFVQCCDTGGVVYVGWDLRASSPQIAEWVVQGLREMGQSVVSCGVLPTPALALAASASDAGAIMITGSHIPADRNGIKFYTRAGEISKQDEISIVAALDNTHERAPEMGAVSDGHTAATESYVSRYVSAFGVGALQGLKIGLYQHSSVARDALQDIFQQLGAEVIPLERTETFVPVDTEAVDPEARAKFNAWCQTYALDALVSTDGDADRPMVTDHSGQIVPGDVLGALTSKYLGADTLCTPVSSNSMISEMSEFGLISLTKIGSPYVVAAIEAALNENASAKVVGYEANGGFLLGFTASCGAGDMLPLLTRDCALPMIAPLVMMKAKAVSLAELVTQLPQRFTAADRVAGIEAEISGAFISTLAQDAAQRAVFFAQVGGEESIDLTDGLRVSFTGGEVVHLRPSGNAPECRCYAEAGSAQRARDLVDLHLGQLHAKLAG